MSSDADCLAAVRALEIAAVGAQALYNAQKHKEALDEATAAQYEIASQIQGRANALHGVWTNNYLPCELATLAEVCAEPIKTTDHAGIYAEETSAVMRRFSVAANTMAQTVHPCITLPCEMAYAFPRDMQRSQAWQSNGAMRAQEAKVYVQNAQRLTNKMNMVNVGRHGAATASAASDAASKILKGVADQAAAAFNSALQTAGRAFQGLPEQLGKLFGSGADKGYTVDSSGESLGSTENRDLVRQAEYNSGSDYYGTPAPTSSPPYNEQASLSISQPLSETEQQGAYPRSDPFNYGI